MTSTTHHTGERRECAVEGCERRVHARGICSRHYGRAAYRGQLPQPRRRGFFGDREIDPCAVARLVAGEPPEVYTGWERREAVRILRQQDVSYREIARRLGTYHRMVHRDLRALGLIGVAS